MYDNYVHVILQISREFVVEFWAFSLFICRGRASLAMKCRFGPWDTSSCLLRHCDLQIMRVLAGSRCQCLSMHF